MTNWQRVRVKVDCAFGHPVQAGAWVRYGKHWLPICEPCLREKYGLERPILPDEGADDFDARKAQAGDEPDAA